MRLFLVPCRFALKKTRERTRAHVVARGCLRALRVLAFAMGLGTLMLTRAFGRRRAFAFVRMNGTAGVRLCVVRAPFRFGAVRT